jgi:hypothetical protein
MTAALIRRPHSVRPDGFVPGAAGGGGAVPFYPYVALKSVFSALLGAFAACAALCAGMCRDRINCDGK